MHVEFLVEEESCRAALEHLLPRMIPDASFRILTHEGKADLLAKLPGRLRAYRAWLPTDWRIVVLVDADRPEDCRRLKAELEATALRAGLRTRARAGPRRRFSVLIRLAVEELEAWFFGDVAAIHAAYPRVSPSLGTQAAFREPDAIRGGTWEALQRVLQGAGYHRAGLPKSDVARAVAAHMDPSRNRSKSFQVFRDGLLALAATAP